MLGVYTIFMINRRIRSSESEIRHYPAFAAFFIEATSEYVLAFIGIQNQKLKKDGARRKILISRCEVFIGENELSCHITIPSN